MTDTIRLNPATILLTETTIKTLWENFAIQVLPENVGDSQRRSMMYAFIAGAHSIMGVLAAIGDSPISEDEGSALLDRLSSELMAFFEEVNKTLPRKETGAANV